VLDRQTGRGIRHPFGISTIHLAVALRDGGGGQLIGQLEPTKAQRAQENLAAAALVPSPLRLGPVVTPLILGTVINRYTPPDNTVPDGHFGNQLHRSKQWDTPDRPYR
jgi:hypothetical protein